MSYLCCSNTEEEEEEEEGEKGFLLLFSHPHTYAHNSSVSQETSKEREERGEMYRDEHQKDQIFFFPSFWYQTRCP